MCLASVGAVDGTLQLGRCAVCKPYFPPVSPATVSSSPGYIEHLTTSFTATFVWISGQKSAHTEDLCTRIIDTKLVYENTLLIFLKEK